MGKSIRAVIARLSRSPGLSLRAVVSGLVLVGAALAVPAAAPAQPALPDPVGYVNDFANVLPAESRARLEALATRVHELTRGDMVIVTMADLGGRPKEEVALQLGRTWKIGANTAIGDSARNAGVVILVVPKETSRDGRGHCRIEVGQGAEGFITDATAGTLCRDVIPLFQQRDYAGAIEQISGGVAQRYARAFGVNLDGTPARRARNRGNNNGSELPIILLVLFVVIILPLIGALSRGRRRGGSVASSVASDVGTAIAINVLSEVLRGSRGSRGGWGGGGWGGGGGGGFGGFGGGGGFSGGGGGSDW